MGTAYGQVETDKPRVAVETVQLRQFDSAALAHVVAGADFDHKRLPGGGSDLKLLQCSLPHAVVNRGIYAPAVLVNGTFARNAITIGTMVRQQQPTLINGHAVLPGSVQFYAENSELCYRAWPNATWLAVVIPRERLLQFCLDHFNHVPDLPDAGVVHLESPFVAVSRSLMAGLRELDHSLRALSKEENSARLGESVERDLLARLSSAICRRPSVRRSYDRRRLRRCTEMLRDSMALVENDSQEVLDLQAMSKATGLSPRTLQRTFQAECGLCPQEWFRVERLNRARQDLLNAGPAASVTRAATRWGFFHLGRFAYYYHELFGESPSETLRWERRMQRRME